MIIKLLIIITLTLCAAVTCNANPCYAGGDYAGDLVTLGVRDLSPKLSRFLEADPEHQFSSDYSYAASTPVTVADPTGAVVGAELIAVRLIDDTRGLFQKNAMTDEDTQKVSYAHISAMKRSISLVDFFMAADAAVLFNPPASPERPWHVASCSYCASRPRRLSLKPYQEELGTSAYKRSSRDRTMFGFQGDTDIGEQLLDDIVIVRHRNNLLDQYKRRMEFLADPQNRFSSPLSDYRNEPDDLYKTLRDTADRMAERVAYYDAEIAKRREQAGAYRRGLELVRTRYQNAGFLYFAQRDPLVLRSLHNTHRSLMPTAVPKSRWSWLPWKRK